LHRRGIQAGVTTRYHQPGVGIAALQAPDLLARFPVRLRGDRSGIENQHVGLFGIGGDLMPKLHELAGPGFELGLVQPASQRLEVDKHPMIHLSEKVRGF
jgi:hypothetical protein